MIALPLAPIWILEFSASIIVLIFNLLALRISYRLMALDPENALWLFLNWLAIVFVVFSCTHLVSHSLQDLIVFSGFPQLGLARRIF